MRRNAFVSKIDVVAEVTKTTHWFIIWHQRGIGDFPHVAFLVDLYLKPSKFMVFLC